MFQKNCKENQNPRLIFNIFSVENPAVNEIMCKKFTRAGQATDDNKRKKLQE